MKMSINKKRILKCILWTMLLLPVYKVGYIDKVYVLDLCYDIGRYISIILCMLIGIHYCKEIIGRKNVILLIISKLFIVLLNLTMGVHNIDSFYSLILVVMQAILFFWMLKKDNSLAIATFLLTFEIIVYINFFSVILHPEGLYNFESERIFTFIGHANSTVYFTLPLLSLSFICLKQGKYKLRVLIDIIVCILSQILVKSSTSAVVFFSFFILLFWYNNKRIKWKYFTIYISILAISSGFVFFHMQSLFSNIIHLILKRRLDFTGRTFYWGRTLMGIKNNPLLGHGAIPAAIRPGGLSAHSFLLETLYEGGILLLILFSSFFYTVSKKLYRYQQNIVGSILFISIVSITITCITESNISYDVFFVLFLWACYADLFVSA